MLAFVFWLSVAPPIPEPPAPWRLVSRPDLHVGLRPAVFVTSDGPEIAVGATVQITTLVLQ